jgi:hypothetical protein
VLDGLTATSARHRFFLAALAFFTVLVIGYGSDLILARHPLWMVSDDLVLGIAAAIVVFHYEKERSRFLSEKLRVIREMNSFVRNELQVLYACLDHPEKARLPTIERSVERIDWALRELLPGGHIQQDSPVGKIREHPRDSDIRSV